MSTSRRALVCAVVLMTGCGASAVGTRPSNSIEPTPLHSSAAATPARTASVAATRQAEVFAGSELKGNDGDGGPANEAELFKPIGLAMAPDGTVYVAECDPNRVSAEANRVRRVTPDGVIDTIVGELNSAPGFSGDGGPATQAQLNCPFALAADGEGNVYIADVFNNRVRMIDATGVITTIAGTGEAIDSGDDGPANEASLNLPGEVLIAPDGGLLIASGPYIRKIAVDGTITTIAGGGTPPDAQMGLARWNASQEGKPAIDASFSDSGGMAWGVDGSLYFADYWDDRVLQIDPDGVLHSIAGDGTKPLNADEEGDGGLAVDAKLRNPSDVAMGPDRSLYILEHYGHIKRVTPDGVIDTFDLGWNYNQAQSIWSDGEYLYVADREGGVVVRTPIEQ